MVLNFNLNLVKRRSTRRCDPKELLPLYTQYWAFIIQPLNSFETPEECTNLMQSKVLCVCVCACVRFCVKCERFAKGGQEDDDPNTLKTPFMWCFFPPQMTMKKQKKFIWFWTQQQFVLELTLQANWVYYIYDKNWVNFISEIIYFKLVSLIIFTFYNRLLIFN